MAGLYIHIPFCRKACHYCNFHFSTSLQNRLEVIAAIEREMEMRSNELHEEINTIYFGGGTPSLLEIHSLESILNAARNKYKIGSKPEITLEANPDDISKEKAEAWKSIGINRFSIGIQSFAEENLQWMNRAHNAQQSLSAIATIKEAGFDNFSIDLIYGTPGQPKEGWIKDLQTAIDLEVQHLSCYALTVEEKTALHSLINKGELAQVDQDEQAERFEILMEMTNKAGYHHYEISNFAKPGFESKHNSAYWEGISYLGFGPSAHSFNGSKRKWNIANNALYTKSIQANILPLEEEILSKIDVLNEYIMTSLRQSKGIEKKGILQRGGQSRLDEITKLIQPYVATQKVVEDEKGWQLTNFGKFFADGIAAALFVVDAD
jgi:oxygen-independent coproporphyrinogen-3 oxidase